MTLRNVSKRTLVYILNVPKQPEGLANLAYSAENVRQLKKMETEVRTHYSTIIQSALDDTMQPFEQEVTNFKRAYESRRNEFTLANSKIQALEQPSNAIQPNQSSIQEARRPSRAPINESVQELPPATSHTKAIASVQQAKQAVNTRQSQCQSLHPAPQIKAYTKQESRLSYELPSQDCTEASTTEHQMAPALLPPSRR